MKNIKIPLHDYPVKEFLLEHKKVPLPQVCVFEAEAILIEIGRLLGFETYTADPAKIYDGKKLSELTELRTIPEPLQGTKNIRRIDVIWYNESSPPNYFFEVEDKGT